MATVQYLLQNPRRALGALAALAAAVGIAVGSGASFTATSANPSNTFAAGTLSILNSREGLSVLTASNMRPGDPAATGTVDVQNAGSLSGTFTLGKSALTNSDAANPLTDVLNLVVTDCGNFSAGAPVCGDADDAQKYSGTITAMGTVSMGTFAASEKHRYRFSVQLDGSALNVHQGDNASVQFDWNAS
jgi:spore coat-associated protein N